MGASNHDSNLIVISYGKIAYYSCHKGVGNILFEWDLGIFSGKKPRAKSAFNRLSHFSWGEWIVPLDKPLTDQEAGYGYLVINFDTKTIYSRSGYAEPNYFNTQWILNSLMSIFDTKNNENVLSDKSIVYLYEHGFMKMRNNNGKLFDFSLSLKEFYEKTKKFRFNTYAISEQIPELKELSDIFITLPKEWILINQEDDIENYDNELELLLKKLF